MSSTENTHIDDKQLLLKIKAGDERAFELLFKHYYPHLVIFAQRYLSDRANSESLVQDVFLKMWEKRSSLDIRSLKGYLVVTVRNQCHNELKHQAVVRAYEKVDNAETEVWPEYRETHYLDRINKVINELPKQRQIIFKMSRMDGLKYREIAEQLNISPKTVEAQMGKALKFLREHLQPIKKQILTMFL
ncbi:RNA polymerase sigma-70 factor [Carboxylicivirga sp. N1Y90]|uniref:RNA polymerase sigma-70 factor n=1 Tax=Carboxylicivirga fragile TaxID=3417571 RepID=UPI003D34F178|nr:RNA polymerase sigma-70 factor [Marinilabiliaceae bacterium N1Y90]